MATPTGIILDKPIVVIESGSISGITPITNNLSTGTVRMVWEGSEIATVGDIVAFDKTGAEYFQQSGNTFILVDENNIKFRYATH